MALHELRRGALGRIRRKRAELEMVDPYVGIDTSSLPGFPQTQAKIRLFVVARGIALVEAAEVAKIRRRDAEKASGDVVDVPRIGKSKAVRRPITEMALRNAAAPETRTQILDRAIELLKRSYQLALKQKNKI